MTHVSPPSKGRLGDRTLVAAVPRRPLWAYVAALSLCAVGLIILSASFDARIATAAQALSPTAVAWGQELSDIGMSGYMFTLSLLVAAGGYLGRRFVADPRADEALTLLAERAVYIVLTLAAGGLMAQLIKHLVGRARPKLIDTFGPYHFDMLSMKNSLASFPSGHATTAFSMAVALGFVLPRWRIPLVVLATLVALSRIVVQAHYISDIMAGGALGAVTATLVARAAADRSFAFVWDGDGVRLKGAGVVGRLLLGQTAAS